MLQLPSQSSQEGRLSEMEKDKPERISMIEMDDWIITVNADGHEMQVASIERVTVDSGVAVLV